jgi:hypothetical protein
MSSLTLEGVVLNVLDVPVREGRDGKSYGGYSQVQIMAEDELQNGDKKMNLHTFRCDNKKSFEARVSQRVRVPVGVFASGGGVVFFMPAGAEVQDV